MMSYWRYLRYLARHKWYVFVAACRLGIPWRGLTHDLSKFRPSEFFPYRDFFYGEYPEQVYGDARNLPIRTKADVQRDFDRAWLFHQHRSRHHWQFWILREDDGGTKALAMPDADRREMLADWMGAGRAITGRDNTAAWYAANQAKMQLHPETREWIERRLGLWA